MTSSGNRLVTKMKLTKTKQSTYSAQSQDGIHRYLESAKPLVVVPVVYGLVGVILLGKPFHYVHFVFIVDVYVEG